MCRNKHKLSRGMREGERKSKRERVCEREKGKSVCETERERERTCTGIPGIVKMQFAIANCLKKLKYATADPPYLQQQQASLLIMSLHTDSTAHIQQTRSTLLYRHVGSSDPQCGFVGSRFILAHNENTPQSSLGGHVQFGRLCAT